MYADMDGGAATGCVAAAEAHTADFHHPLFSRECSGDMSVCAVVPCLGVPLNRCFAFECEPTDALSCRRSIESKADDPYSCGAESNCTALFCWPCMCCPDFTGRNERNCTRVCCFPFCLLSVTVKPLLLDCVAPCVCFPCYGAMTR